LQVAGVTSRAARSGKGATFDRADITFTNLSFRAKQNDSLANRFAESRNLLFCWVRRVHKGTSVAGAEIFFQHLVRHE